MGMRAQFVREGKAVGVGNVFTDEYQPASRVRSERGSQKGIDEFVVALGRAQQSKAANEEVVGRQSEPAPRRVAPRGSAGLTQERHQGAAARQVGSPPLRHQ